MPTGLRLKSSFTLEGRRVGLNAPVFVIAEIGINHNGDPRLAKKMIDAAVRAGADCVKFQTFRAEEFMADREQMYEYKVRGKKVRENMYDMFKRVELPLQAYKSLFAYARKMGVVPMTSVADPESLALIRKVGVSGLKTSSEDLINLPLIEACAKSGLPLILSTGMGDAEDVKDCLRIVAKHKVSRAVFLHCVSLYPTPDREANLDRMLALQEMVKGPVGYSDHTEGSEACLGAVAMGACVIEKHFTLSRSMHGPDQALSSDPKEFAELVRGIRRMEALKGARVVAPSKTELKTRLIYRRSIVAARDLPAGHVLRRADLVLKRPGYGLKAREMPKVLGKKLKKAVRADQRIIPTSVR